MESLLDGIYVNTQKWNSTKKKFIDEEEGREKKIFSTIVYYNQQTNGNSNEGEE